MKRLGLTLGAAALLAVAPLAELVQTGSGEAYAQSRKRAAKEPAAAPANGDPVRGKAEAPALVQRAGLQCSVADATLMGQTKAADGTNSSIYEVACSEGPGYILIAKADGSLQDGYECFALKSGNEAQAAEGKPVANALNCRLPANADPLQGFRKLAAPVVPGCTIDQARYLGSNPQTKEANYEVGCQGRPGAIVKIAGPGSPAKASAIPCEQLGANSTVRCEYTAKSETLAPIAALVAKSGRPCQVSDGRYVGQDSRTNQTFYEAKCAEGAGFMVVSNADASFNRAIDCARAENVGGGCQLTDAIAAQTQEAGVYRGLAQRAGFNCDVGQYRVLGMETTTKREVVELQCKNTPEGVIAFFPAQAGQKADIYDCSKNWRHRQICSLTKPDAVFPRLTKDVARNGKTCQVTGFRGAGLTSKRKTEFVEVSCASGPGLMLEYVAEGAPVFAPATGVFTCAEATNIGEGCKLSGASRS